MRLAIDVPDGSEVVIREAAPISQEAAAIVLHAVALVRAWRRGNATPNHLVAAMERAVDAYEAKVPGERFRRETE